MLELVLVAVSLERGVGKVVVGAERRARKVVLGGHLQGVIEERERLLRPAPRVGNEGLDDEAPREHVWEE